MKVLAVIDSLDPGGAERSLVDTLAAMPGEVEAAIAVFRRSTTGFEADAAAAGIPVHHVPGRFLARARGVRRLARRLSADVVHASLWNADLATRLGLTGCRVALVSSLVNDTYDDRRIGAYSTRRRTLVRVVRLADRVSARRVDHFHAVTGSVRDHYVAALGLEPSRITVAFRGREASVHRVPTPSERAGARAELGVSTPVVLAVGRLEPQKDLVTFVDAVASVATRHEDVVALVAGRDGNDGPRVRACIDERGLGDRVQLLGHRSDVPALLGAADCFVLTSRYEGTAGVVIEAMLGGVPVVASDLPGVREVTDGGAHARLVPAGDAPAFAEAIEAALTEGRDHGRVGLARAWAEERFTMAGAAGGLLAIYRTAIEARS